MKQLCLYDGTMMPKLGQGTWFMGENPNKEADEIMSLRSGVKQGLKLIDTAEMYGEGLAESLIGKAISTEKREKLFLVSKVYPHNAGRDRIFQSCENTLERLKTDYLDLYLLHWRGSVPLKETVECMEELVAMGKIKHWGVSNFDIADMEELWSVPNGNHCAVNQVLYHLGSRGVEYSLLPWMEEHRVPMMAYCPLAQAGDLRRELLLDPTLQAVARKHGLSEMQVLLAFVLRQENVIAIPKAGTPEHVRENAQMMDFELPEEDYEALSQAFPAPNRKTYLDIV